MFLKKSTLLALISIFIGCNENTNNNEEKEKTYPPSSTLTKRLTDQTILRPELNSPTYDPVFNTTINLVNKSDKYISSYPKVQTWSLDMNLLRIGYRLYDNDLTESSLTKGIKNPYSTLCSPLGDYFRWSNQNSNSFFVLNSSKQFIAGSIMHKNIDCSQILFDFKEHGYEYVEMGPNEGNIDNNDEYVTFVVKEYNDDTLYILLFDISEEKVVWVNPFFEGKWVKKHHWEVETLDWVSVSQSGKYILINTPNAMYHYDINFKNQTKLEYNWHGKQYSEGGHGDFCYDTQDQELFVQNIGGAGVYSFNLEKPSENGKVLLNSPYGGGHISCRNIQRPGWAYITREEEGYKEVFALKLDNNTTPNVQEFSQTHAKYGHEESYGAPCPDGTEVIFNSHWGKDKLDTFVATSIN